MLIVLQFFFTNKVFLVLLINKIKFSFIFNHNFNNLRFFNILLILQNLELKSYLVDPASSDMLVLKIKPCMCKYKWNSSETANGSLYQL